MADTNTASSTAAASSTAPSFTAASTSSSAAPSSSTAASSTVASSTTSSTVSTTTSSSAAGSSSGGSTSSASATSASGSSVSQSLSQSASASASAASASTVSASQSEFTSSVVVTVTLSNGQTSLSQSAVVTSTGGAGNHSTRTNTGAIVGGVVGGVAGLIILVGLLWFFLRKRKSNHRDDFDDMMFDPSRAQNHAQVDLADNSGPTVEPFYTPGVASTATSPEMSQYPRSAATTSDGGYDQAAGVSRGPSSASSAGYAGRGAGQYGNMPMPMPTIPDQFATGAGAAAAGGAGLGAASAMNAKQREAYNDHQRFHVANQSYGQPGGSGTQGQVSPGSTSPGGVTVHTDGGRIPVDEDQPNLGNEIPPTYDSIGR